MVRLPLFSRIFLFAHRAALDTSFGDQYRLCQTCFSGSLCQRRVFLLDDHFKRHAEQQYVVDRYSEREDHVSFLNGGDNGNDSIENIPHMCLFLKAYRTNILRCYYVGLASQSSLGYQLR